MATTSNTTKLDPAMLLESANLASQFSAISASVITCEIHENCDGSCSGNGPTVFEPLKVGESKYRAGVEDRPTLHLPLVQENPVQIPTEGFQYTPIDSEAGEIRVLRIQDAVFRADPVVVDVVTINLSSSDCPNYGALSYYWGEPKFDHSIICDGKALQVNASLHECLKRHRRDWLGKPEFLWADAICINQKDKDELNLQLLLMGKIYQSAEIVFVDLGDIPLQWYVAYDLMFRTKVICHLLKDQQPPGTMDNFNERFALPPFDHIAWKAYMQLFSSPWLRRTWTIQEMVLARQIRVRFGRFNFDWDDIVNTSDFIALQRVPITTLTSHEQQIGLLNFSRIRRIQIDFRSGRLTPMQLLWRARESQVSNPRDKVIALLGMLLTRRSTFRPDYTWSTDKLFYHFAAYVLEQFSFTERAAMLSYAGLHRRQIVGNLPSWAPDWLAQSDIGPAVFTTIREKPFDAAKGSLPVMYALGDYEKGECFITQTSLSLGKITHLSVAEGDERDESSQEEANVLRRESHEDKMREMLQAVDCKWLRWYQAVSQVLLQAISEGKLRYNEPEEAFARTLLAGDQYTDQNATLTSVPINNPREALAATVAEISAGKSATVSIVTGSVANIYKVQALVACRRRRFGITDQGYMGLVPSCSQIGDEVHILGGATVPFVMRHRAERNFILVGDAYIHGVMEGEAVQDFKFPGDWKPVYIF
jgi:hypothetical protein